MGKLTTTFPVVGTNEIEIIEYKDGKIYINSAQYFECVDREIFDFYIGGYQPAQKWLKDRMGRQLTYDDILHYQKIIKSIQQTILLMSHIDSIISSS